MSGNGKLTVLVGGQYGSEGKGVIMDHIAKEYDYHVRVGGPNAGHSFVFNGEVFKMQSIPCGWTNPNAILCIGAGGVIHLRNLFKEIDELREKVDPDIDERIWIDSNAGILSEDAFNTEGGIHGEMHKRIGSTGEGVGEARLRRIKRDPALFQLAKDVPELQKYIIPSVSEALNNGLDSDMRVIIEGTQGSGLSLFHGPWPYCTSNDTNASGLLAEVGLAPTKVTDVIVVARTHPIRVAGNSGPLNNELTWEQMSAKVGKPVEEKTTVTLKTRRVGEWDDELFARAVRLNGPTAIALTFADYISPEDEGKTEYDELSFTTKQFVDHVEEIAKTPVDFIGTGGVGWAVVDRR